MKYVIIDVREPHEFSQGHVEGALNLPPQVLITKEPDELKDLSRDTPLVVYCRTGNRSNATIPYLRNYGFTTITNGINKEHVKKTYFS